MPQSLQQNPYPVYSIVMVIKPVQYATMLHHDLNPINPINPTIP